MKLDLERLLHEDLPSCPESNAFAPVTEREASANRAALDREMALHERAARKRGRAECPPVPLPPPPVPLEVCGLCGHPLYRHELLLPGSVSDDAPCPDCPGGVCRAPKEAVAGLYPDEAKERAA